MSIHTFLPLILAVISLVSCDNNCAGDQFAGWDYNHMKAVKKEIRSESSPYYPAFRKLIEDAEDAMKKGPYSVTYKDMVPPGGHPKRLYESGAVLVA